jgi:hypothetical protein
VIEILLKARLLEAAPEVRNVSAGGRLSGRQARRWALVWRFHDLEGLLAELPQVEESLRQLQVREGIRYRDDLKSICASWTVFARYSTQSATIAEAVAMKERVRRLKGLLQ